MRSVNVLFQGGQEFNVGVFYYASQASPGNLLPLARILLEYGADINLIRSRIIISSKELQRRTPVDEFYRQSADSVAAFLIEAGGKCLRQIRRYTLGIRIFCAGDGGSVGAYI